VRKYSLTIASLVFLILGPGLAGGGQKGNERLAVGVFLVAAPEMGDPRFSRAVILLVQHSAEGSMGLIINKKSDVAVTYALPELESTGNSNHVLYFGGPVQPARIMYVYTGASSEPDQKILDNVYWGTSYERLQDLANNLDRGSLRVFFGYAGWGPGQLEFELSLNSWQLEPASPDHVFSSDTKNMWRLLNGAGTGVITKTLDSATQPYL
jgi:putative transcriptional regulator